MIATSTLIPAVLVIVTSAKLGSLSYYNLLTPDLGEYQDLVITGLLSMLLIILLKTILIVALTVNIYVFSEKIFHLLTYRRIL